VLCGLAPSLELLIAARALAGMGGGGILTGWSLLSEANALIFTDVDSTIVANVTLTDMVPL
jgi:MFS family permease